MTTAETRGEFGRIDRFFKPLAAGFPGALGLRNDAAVFGVPPGHELVVTTDAMVAGVHFFADDSPGDIAAKLLAVNLSDLAAMGAEPLAYSLALCLPKDIDDDWLAGFAAGLAAGQAAYAFHLSGGDSVSTPGPVVLALTAFGVVPAGRALPRDGGPDAVGALLCVTGTPGDAALGLACAFGDVPGVDAAQRDYLLERLRRPTPRLAVGRGLRGLALACLDVSDGVLGDLAHLARESGCAAVVEAARLPLSSAAAAVLAADPSRLRDVLTGGDDYELLFAIRPEHWPAAAALARETDTPITAIGRLIAGPAGRVTALDAAGAPLVYDRLGWTHD